MYISGAKFEEHCSKISGDILISVFYCFCGTIYDIMTLSFALYKNVNICETRKDIPKRKTLFSITLKSLSTKQQLCFTS